MNADDIKSGTGIPAAASENKTSGRPSRVERTVRKLFELSMAADAGDYLGSEAELIENLDVSRPTLRQAAKIVQSQNLLEVRRGAAGGFFAARPDARDIVQAPAFFLRMQKASLQQMRRASAVIQPEIIADAAQNADGEKRERLRAIVEAIDSFGNAIPTPRQLLEFERALSGVISSMCGNPFLRLFYDITYEFGLLERNLRFYDGHPNRCNSWLTGQRDLCAAVSVGDVAVAVSVSKKRSQLIENWISEDHSFVNKHDPETHRKRQER